MATGEVPFLNVDNLVIINRFILYFLLHTGNPHCSVMTAGREDTRRDSGDKGTRGSKRGDGEDMNKEGKADPKTEASIEELASREEGMVVSPIVPDLSDTPLKYEYLSSVKIDKKFQYLFIGCVTCCCCCIILILSVRLINDYMNRMDDD